MKKVSFLMILISLSVFVISFNTYSYIVLVDPGHGGDDEGAKGILKLSKNRSQIIYEKDLALKISKKIYLNLKKMFYKVYLTRSLDRSVTLEQRAELAEKLKADLFLSIHINSSVNKRSKGFEIFYLDNHSDAAVKKLEKVENRNLQGEDLLVQKILTDLVIERTVVKSKQLANNIHKEVKKKIRKYKIIDRGVKPGLFYVLTLSKRPGVLIEIAFISNQKDLSKMVKDKFINECAKAITAGVDKYVKANMKLIPAML